MSILFHGNGDDINSLSELGIGLDLSTASTGLFTVIDGNFERGVPQIVKCPDGPDRDKRMSDMVIDTIKHWSPKPSWAAIEEIYMGDNVKTLKKLQALRTRVEDYLKDAGIVVYTGYTAQIDSACGITGHLKRPQRKKATRRFAELLYGKLPEDAADALCVAYYGYHERRKDRWLAGDLTP